MTDEKLGILTRGTNDTSFRDVWRRANPHCFSQAVDDGADGLAHRPRTKLESVDLAAWSGDLVYAYIKGEIGICLYVHAALPAIDLEPGDFAMLIFQNECISDDGNPRKGNSGRKPQEGPNIAGLRGDDVQFPVPILSCPVIQNTDCAVQAVGQLGWRKTGRSCVRLYRLDDVALLIREWRDLPTLAIETLGTETNGELQLVLVGGRASNRIQAGGFVNRRVESRTQLIQELTEFEGNFSGDGGGLFDPDKSPPVVVHIDMGVVRFFFDKRIPSGGDSVAVGVCAPDTLPTNIEWFAHD
jgi:hypothetical protein